MWPYSDKPVRLALIGMSGSGKTYWAKRIAAAGYPAISCDTEIEDRLRPHLEAGRHSGINGVAAWMGWPDRATYAEREDAYLAEEIGALDEVLNDLEKNHAHELILDTSGSVIYAGNHLLGRLRKQMLVVHLATTTREQQLLVRRYLEDPKPVLWRGAFRPRKGETPHDTVARCYPTLIAARRESYETLAHCSLSVSDLRGLSLRERTHGESIGRGFLEKVRKRLERAGKRSPADTAQ